ncbi:MAG: FecR domain-containing protein [Pyrinomonadaceae bacterium]
MFSQHVAKDLSAYCNGETAGEHSRRIAEHLIACNRCREQFEEIKLGVKLAEQLPQLSAPESLWRDLQVQLDSAGALAQQPRPFVSTQKFTIRSWRLAPVAGLLLLITGLGVFYFYPRSSEPFWEVVRLDGSPRIASSPIDEKGRLTLGQWLETDGSSRAQIEVGTIGEVEIDPNTRVRLIAAKLTEHRLELARGKMSARISAPPRLFFVDTPSAVAADLGCAYTLEVDDDGAGILHVTTGWVALQLKDKESMVPAGASCATRPGIGPGTPYFKDASDNFRMALAKFDFEPEDKSWSTIPTLDVLLDQARPRDSLTLWHLLSRVEGTDRERVYDRLAVLVAPPEGVTRAGVLQLNEEMLQRWRDQMETSWAGESQLRQSVGLWIRAIGNVKGLIR